MYWFVRRRQRRIQAQLVLFKQSGLWAHTGETKSLLAEDSEADVEDEEEEKEGEEEEEGEVLVEVPGGTETEFSGEDTAEEWERQKMMNHLR